MRLLIIKPGPDVKTDEELEVFRDSLFKACETGVVFAHPDAMSYEVVEFDSITYDGIKEKGEKK
jgi:hypothetical protein